MPLIPLTFPPGLFKNATPYARKGRWTNGNLVRWRDDAVRPIGGWLRRQNATGNIPALIADTTLEAVRDIFSWRDNDQNQNTVFGSNLALYYMSQNNTVTDITFAGYVPINAGKDGNAIAGYGQNSYGDGAFGAENNLQGAEANPPDRWFATNFGEILLTGVRNNSTIYELDFPTLTLSPVLNAPSKVQDAIVTEERVVFAIGTNGEPRRIQSTDVEDRTDWTPVIANQATDRILAGNGRLLRCLQVLRQILILGENDANVARYIGPPYVYAIDEVGSQCGLISAEAVAKTDKFAVWWGKRNFWLYDGSLQILDCSVLEFLYRDLDPIQVGKISCFTISEYSEVWWLYQSQSTTTTEVDSYVTWNYRLNYWMAGKIDRTAGTDIGTLLKPILVDSAGRIFNHELENVYPTGGVFVESEGITAGEGDQNMEVHYIYPDSDQFADIEFYFKTRQFPTAPEFLVGPYPYNNPTPVRVSGRAIKFGVNFLTAGSALGICRGDVTLGGER